MNAPAANDTGSKDKSPTTTGTSANPDRQTTDRSARANDQSALTDKKPLEQSATAAQQKTDDRSARANDQSAFGANDKKLSSGTSSDKPTASAVPADKAKKSETAQNTPHMKSEIESNSDANARLNASHDRPGTQPTQAVEATKTNP